MLFLIRADNLFFDKFVAESEKAAMAKALADLTEFETVLPKTKAAVAGMSTMMKLTASLQQDEAEGYKAEVDSSKKLLVSQVKEFTDARKQLGMAKDVAGRKKRLAALHFPHIMTFNIFEAWNAKVCLARDADGSSGTAKANIFLYAAWKVTSGATSWQVVFKLLVCSLFQVRRE